MPRNRSEKDQPSQPERNAGRGRALDDLRHIIWLCEELTLSTNTADLGVRGYINIISDRAQARIHRIIDEEVTGSGLALISRTIPHD